MPRPHQYRRMVIVSHLGKTQEQTMHAQFLPSLEAELSGTSLGFRLATLSPASRLSQTVRRQAPALFLHRPLKHQCCHHLHQAQLHLQHQSQHHHQLRLQLQLHHHQLHWSAHTEESTKSSLSMPHATDTESPLEQTLTVTTTWSPSEPLDRLDRARLPDFTGNSPPLPRTGCLFQPMSWPEPDVDAPTDSWLPHLTQPPSRLEDPLGSGSLFHSQDLAAAKR
mmetsp:Transcript_2797/g.5672  ORF Transcript_2797/g.5672 Transcript_2797/m.5672 type:complete len:223 (+) Transcript_2797:1516-2184(+)